MSSKNDMVSDFLESLDHFTESLVGVKDMMVQMVLNETEYASQLDSMRTPADYKTASQLAFRSDVKFYFLSLEFINVHRGHNLMFNEFFSARTVFGTISYFYRLRGIYHDLNPNNLDSITVMSLTSSELRGVSNQNRIFTSKSFTAHVARPWLC
jgi:hypothetical protein